MRTFQLISLLIFFGFYMLISFGSYYSLKKIVKPKWHRWLKTGYPVFHLVLLVMFIAMYIYPFQPVRSGDYTFHLRFNIILFTVFMFHLPMSLAALLHVVFRRRKKPVIPYTGLLISLPMAAGMIYGTVGGVNSIRVIEQELHFQNLPEEFEGFRIALFTDTHLGGMVNAERMMAKASSRIEEAHPDMILFAGDLVNNFAYETEGLDGIFREITRDRPSYSILGNHDYGDYSRWESEEKKRENFEGILDATMRMGFRMLRNENIVMKRGNDSIYIAGVENWGHPPFPQYADLDDATDGIPSDAFTILLSHDPAHWESIVKNRDDIELTFSGHTHGMQWGIKVAGIPFSLAWLTRKYWGGLYYSGNSALYVNTGFGTVGMPWRLDMPAEITLLTLKRSEVNRE